MRKQQPKNSLTQILKEKEGALHVPEPTAPEPVESTSETRRKRPACREGKKVAMCHIDEEASTQLDYLCIETKKTKQALFCEGINLLFVKYDKPPIA